MGLICPSAPTRLACSRARGVAERLARELPRWNVVVMPTVHYGSAGANQIGDVAIHPGTYGVRQSTLRSLIADIGAQVVQNRFKWVFVMNGHGAPTHHVAVNEACDFVSETFKATMLNVSGLFSADAAIQEKGARLAANTFRRPICLPLAGTSMAVFRRHRGYSPFARTLSGRTTRACRVTGRTA